MSQQPAWIPGPSPRPHGGGQVPEFGERHHLGIAPEPVFDQKILCVVCVNDRILDPPQRIVIVDGSSYCVPHMGLTINP